MDENLEDLRRQLQEDLDSKTKQWSVLDKEIASIREQLEHVKALIALRSGRRPDDSDKFIRIELLKVEGPGQSAPRELVVRSGERRTIESWPALLTQVARDMVSRGSITAKDCPVQVPKARVEYLIHTEPRHSQGDFRSPVEIGGGLWLERHGSPDEILGKVQYLLQTFGKAGSYYKVSRM